MLMNTPKVPVDVMLGNGDEVAEGIVAVSTPGHTKGHISIFLPGSSTVITGDALDLDRAKESAEKIRALVAKTIICYHGGEVG